MAEVKFRVPGETNHRTGFIHGVGKEHYTIVGKAVTFCLALTELAAKCDGGRFQKS